MPMRRGGLPVSLVIGGTSEHGDAANWVFLDDLGGSVGAAVDLERSGDGAVEGGQGTERGGEEGESGELHCGGGMCLLVGFGRMCWLVEEMLGDDGRWGGDRYLLYISSTLYLLRVQM